MINPLSGLWAKNRELANKLIIVFSKLSSSYDGKNVISFINSNKKDISNLLSVDEYSLESIDLTILDYNTKLYISALLDCHDVSILNFVITIGEQLWKKLFHDDYDDGIRRIYVLESKYKKWLANYLLNITADGRCRLIQTLMPLVSFNREFNRLLSDIISSEDINPRYDAFWDLWTTMSDYIFIEYEKNVNEYKNIESVVHIRDDYEDVLATYLLAKCFWKEGVTQWHSLKQQNKMFYLIVAKRLGYNPTTLFSVSYVLNTVGKTPFKETGLFFLYDIINNNPHLYEKTLPDNTLFYIEEYVFSYVYDNIDKIQTDIPLKKKVVKILDFLVSKGSTMGFLYPPNNPAPCRIEETMVK